VSKPTKIQTPSKVGPVTVITDLSKKAIAIRPEPIRDPSLRRQLHLKVAQVNRLRGLLHSIPVCRGQHYQYAAENYPGYSFGELIRIAGLSGVLTADKGHHTRVSCNSKLDELIIEPDGTYRVIWMPEEKTPE
jgi:hypothetical protein